MQIWPLQNRKKKRRIQKEKKQADKHKIPYRLDRPKFPSDQNRSKQVTLMKNDKIS